MIDRDLQQTLSRLAESRTDESAWSDLYEKVWPYAFSIVYRKLQGAQSEAEDAGVEVFVRLIQYCPFDRLQEPGAFIAYLSRVTVNICYKYAKDASKREACLVAVSEEITEGQISSSLPPDDRAHLEMAVGKVLNNLPPGDASLFELLLDGFSTSEISTVLDISYENAAVRVHRLRRKLRSSPDLFSMLNKSP
jgi:RNA polymerase sigma factor (sigma-70 family)